MPAPEEPVTPEEPKIIHVFFAICLVASLALLYTRSEEPDLTQIQLLTKYWYLPVTATLSLLAGVITRIRFRDSLKPKPAKKTRK